MTHNNNKKISNKKFFVWSQTDAKNSHQKPSGLNIWRLLSDAGENISSYWTHDWVEFSAIVNFVGL